MIGYALLTIIVILFALNMGASGVAPSFAAVYGARFIGKARAVLLFGVFVILGAALLGKNVAVTLGKSLLPPELMIFDTALIILASATIGLAIANFLKIPQSTSQVAVGAVAGAGTFYGELNLKTLFLKILPAWVLLPLLAYALTLFIYRFVYPPKHNNLHIYEKIFANEKKIRMSALVVSCYVAFAIGSNNVANAVGPLYGAGIIGIAPGLLVIAPLFGIGAHLFGSGLLATAGKGIVPLGLVSSTLVSFVTATLLIGASVMGIPQSLVQLNMSAIFAISCLKDGHRHTWNRHIFQKTVFVWIITPMISLALSYMLLYARSKGVLIFG